jgi:predicted Zn-dependent protease with MMP-like domain
MVARQYVEGIRQEGKVEREHFIQLVEEVLESLPTEFRERIHNLAVLVEDKPKQRRRPPGLAGQIGPTKPRRLLLGVFHGVPATQKSVFDFSTGPNCIILYQRNIEAICRNETEIRHEVCQTVLHELGHLLWDGRSPTERPVALSEIPTDS